MTQNEWKQSLFIICRRVLVQSVLTVFKLYVIKLFTLIISVISEDYYIITILML